LLPLLALLPAPLTTGRERLQSGGLLQGQRLAGLPLTAGRLAGDGVGGLPAVAHTPLGGVTADPVVGAQRGILVHTDRLGHRNVGLHALVAPLRVAEVVERMGRLRPVHLVAAASDQHGPLPGLGYSVLLRIQQPRPGVPATIPEYLGAGLPKP